MGTLLTAAMAGTACAGDLTVFSTSDVHGSVMGWNYFTAQPADVGLAKISTLINEARAKQGQDDAMLVIDAGDILQGTPLDTYMVQHPQEWQEHPMFHAFNQIGYDAILCGNHEFNFGLDYLRKAIGQNQNVLSANTVDVKTNKTWSAVKPYLIRTVKVDGEDVRVGIIGTVTPAIPNFEAPAHYAGVRFDDQIPVIKRCIKELQAQGVDLIIAAVHSGVQRGDRNAVENQVIGIAQACPELALLIAAHNHVVIDNATGIKGPDGTVYPGSVINGVPVVESGKDGKFLGESKLTLHKVNGKWQVQQVKTQAVSVKGVPDDAAIVRDVQPWHQKTLAHLQQVIGTATDEFSGAESNHQDSAIVDFVNNAQREIAGTQLSAAAAFNTKQNIAKGPITLQEMSGLYIYENYLYGIEITGAELRKYMAYAADHYGVEPDYNYDMVQGVDYTIDTRKPQGQKLTRLQYQGRDVRDGDTFTLALNDYRFNGGGGYMAAMGYTGDKRPKVVYNSLAKYGDDGQLRTLLVKYIQAKKQITPQVDNNWHVIK